MEQIKESYYALQDNFGEIWGKWPTYELALLAKRKVVVSVHIIKILVLE